jgi:hypothetical protein
MNPKSTANPMLSLYDVDYQIWLDKTLARLQSHDFENIDLDHLIEELSSLGKSDKNAISSYLLRLCEHLLKVKYWETERERSIRGWNLEILNFRIQIQEELEDSPSLSNFLQDNFPKQYKNARKLFLQASGLDKAIVPENPCFTLEQALEEDWNP